MKRNNLLFYLIVLSPLLQSCSVDMKKVEQKAALINKYESVALQLAKENRELHVEVKRLEFEIEKLKQDKSYYDSKNKTGEHAGHGEAEVASNHGGHIATQEHHSLAEHHGTTEHPATSNHEEKSHDTTRAIASIAPSEHSKPIAEEKDYVEFKTYKWHADDMQQIADKEFKEKHFEKAAQFYYSILQNYPHHKGVNDEFYFKAGIAAYESGKHHDWTLSHFETLMTSFPTSQYYRSAKLWIALTNLKMGDKKKFFATVEEFRKKYRNTNEWKILSSYYEKIEEKTNE